MLGPFPFSLLPVISAEVYVESHLHYGSIVPVAGLETLVSLGTKRVSFEVQSRPREDGQEQRNKFKKKVKKDMVTLMTTVLTKKEFIKDRPKSLSK